MRGRIRKEKAGTRKTTMIEFGESGFLSDEMYRGISFPVRQHNKGTNRATRR